MLLSAPINVMLELRVCCLVSESRRLSLLSDVLRKEREKIRCLDHWDAEAVRITCPDLSINLDENLPTARSWEKRILPSLGAREKKGCRRFTFTLIKHGCFQHFLPVPENVQVSARSGSVSAVFPFPQSALPVLVPFFFPSWLL